MLRYPEISRATGTSFRQFQAWVFDKLDGSNLRFAWDRKKSWYRYGTRNRLLDASDPLLGSSIQLFHDTLADDLARLFAARRWGQAIVFAEYWGEHSLAGFHIPEDPKRLTVFDVAVDKKGILPPQEFRTYFEDRVDTPRYLGTHNWTRGFVERVRLGELEGVTLEGVVGKSTKRLGMFRAKAKTQAWIDRVIAFKGEEEGRLLVES